MRTSPSISELTQFARDIFLVLVILSALDSVVEPIRIVVTKKS